ncbi:ribosome silencing factor [Candidatus Poriferisocius sp.]|uniref:ribosome silencing factor n=1 Tax=Candidatus Poriferisocius sp. TaxID=3101276 RepID=UPI003B52A05A
MSVSAADTKVVEDWVRAAAAAAEEGPGSDTLIIDVGDVLVITDHFVITSGANTRAVRALAERIEEAVGLSGGPKPFCIEGLSDYEWVLMDYGDFIVHIFTASARDYYALDLLWKDCPVLAANPLPS